jgi:hypothetical protein
MLRVIWRPMMPIPTLLQRVKTTHDRSNFKRRFINGEELTMKTN